MNINSSPLTLNLLKLRENFDQRLEIKIRNKAEKNEPFKFSGLTEDAQVLEHSEKPVEFRKWLRFFR